MTRRRSLSRYIKSITKEATAVFCCGMPLCIMVLVNIMMKLYDAYIHGISGAFYVYLPYLEYVFSGVAVVLFGSVLADIMAREVGRKKVQR